MSASCVSSRFVSGGDVRISSFGPTVSLRWPRLAHVDAMPVFWSVPESAGAATLGVEDLTSVRWRAIWWVLGASVLGYAPQAGLAQDVRVRCWRDLVASARRVHDIMGLPFDHCEET